MVQELMCGHRWDLVLRHLRGHPRLDVAVVPAPGHAAGGERSPGQCSPSARSPSCGAVERCRPRPGSVSRSAVAASPPGPYRGTSSPRAPPTPTCLTSTDLRHQSHPDHLALQRRAHPRFPDSGLRRRLGSALEVAQRHPRPGSAGSTAPRHPSCDRVGPCSRSASQLLRSSIPRTVADRQPTSPLYQRLRRLS